MATMTGAFNSIKSTLKGALASPTATGLKQGAGMGWNGLKSLAKARSMSDISAVGKGMMGNWKNATGLQKAGMAGVGAGVAGAGYGAYKTASYLNPWGTNQN
jgi:hypothetical protein